MVFLVFALSAMLRNDVKLVGMDGNVYGALIGLGLFNLDFHAFIIAFGIGHFVCLKVSFTKFTECS